MRPAIVGGDAPEAPFPAYLRGTVEAGFGRGSKQLNCPTANLPTRTLTEAADPAHHLTRTGVYFGWAQVRVDTGSEPFSAADADVYPMVMSVGWNPQFQNQEQSVEVHIMHPYPADFCGHDMRVVVLGYIRPEQTYESMGALRCVRADADALMADIDTDKRVGLASLQRPAYAKYKADPVFSQAT